MTLATTSDDDCTISHGVFSDQRIWRFERLLVEIGDDFLLVLPPTKLSG